MGKLNGHLAFLFLPRIFFLWFCSHVCLRPFGTEILFGRSKIETKQVSCLLHTHAHTHTELTNLLSNTHTHPQSPVSVNVMNVGSLTLQLGGFRGSPEAGFP